MSMSLYEMVLERKIAAKQHSKANRSHAGSGSKAVPQNECTVAPAPAPARDFPQLHRFEGRWGHCLGLRCSYLEPGDVPICLSVNQPVKSVLSARGRCPEDRWRIKEDPADEHRHPCPVCNSTAFWRRKNQPRWICAVCHPRTVKDALCELHDCDNGL